MSLSSRELNYLIWRYLQESGFELTTYALQKEASAHVENSRLEPHIQAGALVDLVQKGIQFLEVETAIKSGKTLADAPFTLLGALASHQSKPSQQPNNNIEPIPAPKERPSVPNGQDIPSIQSAVKLDLHDIQLLAETYSGPPATVSQWHPHVATTVAFGTSASNAYTLSFEPFLKSPAALALPLASTLDLEKDITALSWNPSGSLLGLGSFDGIIKLVTGDGKLRHVLSSLHTAPIMSLKWNPSGSLLVSVDCAGTVIVWNASNGDVIQQFESQTSDPTLLEGPNLKPDIEMTNQSSSTPSIQSPPTGSSLPTSDSVSSVGDAEWIDTETYAVTGPNNVIFVYKATPGTWPPLLRFKNHTMPINVLTFDPRTKLLASGSDDCTVQIWHGKSLTPISTLAGHSGPVLTVAWRPPTGNLSLSHLVNQSAPSAQIISASLDGSIRLWDAESGTNLAIFDSAVHEGPVFACAVSPDGHNLASGGTNGKIFVWELPTTNDATADVSGVPSYKFDVSDTTTSEGKPSSEDLTVSTISWSTDSKRIFVGFGTKSVVLSLHQQVSTAAAAADHH